MFDLLVAKKWALKYAVNAACTILRVRKTLKHSFSVQITIVHTNYNSSCLLCHSFTAQITIVHACYVTQVDQIIMAKRAGGPKPRDTSGGMDQDDD